VDLVTGGWSHGSWFFRDRPKLNVWRFSEVWTDVLRPCKWADALIAGPRRLSFSNVICRSNCNIHEHAKHTVEGARLEDGWTGETSPLHRTFSSGTLYWNLIRFTVCTMFKKPIDSVTNWLWSEWRCLLIVLMSGLTWTTFPAEPNSLRNQEIIALVSTAVTDTNKVTVSSWGLQTGSC